MIFLFQNMHGFATVGEELTFASQNFETLVLSEKTKLQYLFPSNKFSSHPIQLGTSHTVHPPGIFYSNNSIRSSHEYQTMSTSSPTTANTNGPSMKRAAFGLGFLLGLVVQGFTLCANVVIAWYMAKRQVETKSDNDTSGLFLAWTFLSTSTALLVLWHVRKLVTSIFWHVHAPSNGADGEDGKTVLAILLDHVEHNFVGGCLVGVGVAWIASDYFLGISMISAHSLVLFVLGMFCWYTGEPDHKVKEKDENELHQDDREDSSLSYVALV